MRFSTYKDLRGQCRWRLTDGSSIVGRSSGGFASHRRAKDNARQVLGGLKKAAL